MKGIQNLVIWGIIIIVLVMVVEVLALEWAVQVMVGVVAVLIPDIIRIVHQLLTIR
jgi:hypothetical protein